MLRPIETDELNSLLAQAEKPTSGEKLGSIRHLGVDEAQSLVNPDLERNWLDTAGGNPDQEAETRRLAEGSGLPAWMVERKPENRQIAKANVEMPDWAKLSKDYPKTANYLGIPENMAMSRDDVETLKAIEDIPKTGLGVILKDALSGQRETSTMQRYAELATPKIMGTRTLSPEEEKELALLDAKLDEEEAGNPAFKGIGNLAQFFLRPMGKASANLIPMTLLSGFGMAVASKGGTGGELLAPVGSALGTAPGAVRAITKATMFSQQIKDSASLETSLSYRTLSRMKDEDGKLLSEIVGEDVIRIASMMGGGLAGLMEFFPMEYFADTIPGIKQMTARRAIIAIMRNETTRKALTSFIKNYLVGLGTEAGTEAIQRGITKGSEELVKAYARSKGAEVDLDSLSEWSGELMQEFAGAVQSFSLAMLPAPSMRAVADHKTAQRAEQNRAMFEQLAGLVDQSTTGKRMPASLASFVDNAVKNGPIETTYVDGEAFVRYFQEQGTPIEDVAKGLDIPVEDILDAARRNDRIAIPTGKYATQVAGTDAGLALNGDIAFAPDEPTAREAEVEKKEQQELLRRDIEEADRLLAEDETLQADLTYAKDLFTAQALGAGVPTEQVEANLPIFESWLKTIRVRYGESPRSVIDRVGLSIRAENGDTITAGGIAYDQDGQIRLNENFYKWFGDSKIVDENGEPRKVFYGDPDGDFASFGPDENGLIHLDLDPGYAKRKSEDTSTARGFANFTPEVGEFYISAQNVFDLGSPLPEYGSLPDALSDVIEDVAGYNDGYRIGERPGDSLSNYETIRDKESIDVLLENPQLIQAIRDAGYDAISYPFEDLTSSGQIEGIAVFDKAQIKSIHNEGTWSGETGNVYQQISKPVRDYAAQNTGWNETSAGVWGMLEALNDFDSRVSALVGKQMSSTQELGVLFEKDPKARKDWENFVPKAARELGMDIVPFNKNGSVNANAVKVIFERKSQLSQKVKDKVGTLVAGHGRTNAFEINKVLNANPDMKAEIQRLQERVDDLFGITPLVDEEGMVTTGIERRPATYPSGEANPNKPKFGGFSRSFSQTFLDYLPDKIFEQFRSELVKAVEHAYANGGNGIKGVKFMDKPLDSVSDSDFKVASVVKKAEKTVGALNLNSNCPMFMIGSHGCYLDGCYVTGMGMGGNTINFYVRGAYTGELLQLSQEDVDLLNSVGGLRLNGQGDLIEAQYAQFKDIVRHAKMRNLKLKVISKQDGTVRMLQKMHDEGIDIDGVQVQLSLDPYWIPIQEDELADSFASVQGLVRSREKKPDSDVIAQAIIDLYASQGREAKVIDGVLMRKYGYSLEKAEAIQGQNPDVQILQRVVTGTPEEIVHYARYYPGILQTWMHAAIRKGMYSEVAGRMLEEGEVGNFTARIAIFRDDSGEWHIQARGDKKSIGEDKTVYDLQKNIRAEQNGIASAEKKIADAQGKIARAEAKPNKRTTASIPKWKQEIAALESKKNSHLNEIERLRGEQQRLISTRQNDIPLEVRDSYSKVEEYIKAQPDADRIFSVLAGSLDGNPSALCCVAGADQDACNNCISHCHAGSRGWRGDPVKVEAMAELLSESQKQRAAVYAQTVWHGSPYRFDKPSLQHIGSGEGAQVFGWGLYGAQLRVIAEEKYWKQLGGEERRRPDADIVAKYQPEWDAVVDKLDALEKQYENGRPNPEQAKQRDVLENELDAIHQKMISESVERHGRGQLQEWDIPGDDVMLHWDDSLYDQPENVKELLRAGGFGGLIDKVDRPKLDGDKLYLNMTGEEFYRMQTEDEGSPKAASEYLNSLGIKGIKYLDGNSRADGEGTYNYVVFDDEAIEVLNTYYQQQEILKGQVAFSDGQSIISLFQSADRSTLLHEMGHVFFENLRQMAGTNEKASADLQEFYDWLEIDDWDALTPEERTQAHEKFARTFEAYLMNGEAPSVGLKRVFATFRKWLIDLYRSIRVLSSEAGQEITLSDDVKDLFARLLATDEEIEQARALAGYHTAVDATAESLAKHAEADDTARAEVGVRSKAELQERRKALTKQVREELESSPGYRALFAMQKAKDKGGVKISDDEIVEEFGDTFLVNMVVPLGISSKQSSWPLADLATRFQFKDGRDLVTTLVNLPPIAKAVRAQVDSMMEAEAQVAQEEAQGALRNEDRLDALSMERDAMLGEVDTLDEAEAPEWLEILEEAEAEKDNPLSRENVLSAVKAEGKISYDALVALWGPDEAKALMKRLGPGMFDRKGLGFDVIAQELQSKGVPVRDVQHLYDILMEPKKEEKVLDVPVDAGSLPWLVWMLGYKDTAKYLKKRRRTLNKEQKEAQEQFDAGREAGEDVGSLRNVIAQAQAELDYIKRALKVVDVKEKVDKTDDDFEVDFDPETFETVEGKVDWQQTTVAEAVEGQQSKTEAATMKDAWTLASRISKIAHREGMKEGRRRAAEAKKQIREKAQATVDARNSWKKAQQERTKARAIAAREMARNAIAQKRVSDIKPSVYIAAEKRAQRAVERALKDNNFEEAGRQKDLQIINAALAMEATRAKRLTSKIERYLKKMDRKKPSKSGALDNDYLDKIHTLLDGFYFGSRRRKLDNEVAGFIEWKKGQEEAGESVEIPDRLIARIGRTYWKDLRLEDLIELGDAVKNLEHLGTVKKTLTSQKQKRDFEKGVNEIVTSVRENIGVRYPVSTKLNRHASDKALSGIRSWRSMHKRMEFLFRELDGQKDMGVTWQYFFRPMVEAQNEASRMSEWSASIVGDLFKLIDVRGLTKERYYEETGEKWSRENLLCLALNWGNLGNRDRVMSGHNWTEAQVQAMLSYLTDAEWDFVQGMWDHINSYWPAIAALYKEMTGVEPTKVEASPFVTPSGRVMRGGYYPIGYDFTKDIKAFEMDEKQKIQDATKFQAMRAQTRDGHVKARAKHMDKQLDLHFDVATTHLRDVIHDLTHRRAVYDVQKLLNDKRVQQAISEAVGMEMWRELKPWLQNIAANGRTVQRNALERTFAFFRKRFTTAILGLKVTTSMMQFFSVFGAEERIGQAGMLHAIADFYGRPDLAKERIAFVMERSIEVRDRRRTWDRDVASIMANYVGSGKKGRVQAAFFWTHGIMDAAAVVPVWLEAYDQKLAETGEESEAIHYADSVVRQTQPASMPKDLPSVMRSGEIMRLFTMFYSYFSVFGQLLGSRIQQTQSVKDMPRLVASLFWLVFVPAVVGPMMTGRGPDDDEDIDKWLLEKTILYPLQGVVGVRDVANYLFHPEYGYQLSPVEAVIKTGSGLVKETKEALFEDDDWMDLAKPVYEAFGYGFGLPVLQPEITVGQLMSYLMGDEPEWDISQLFVRKRR